ncbi:glyoxylate carboligase (tartronate-semialdehyde synthase) [Escherichia coli]|uniref:Glyoxylate carboligase (Tartronate-semialdehyde synthase) n=1 Tax=Escherichia coli TaxID=562 RepID=A0A377KAL4_ECOLX|nr:glyoxylate carboligase (tartronate-semialdehyde synthase) [Escherichia coli]
MTKFESWKIFPINRGRNKMAKMRAVDAAMYVLEKEGITTAFGVPGAAINPFYSAMRKHGRYSSHSGASCGRCFAHGGRLYPRNGREYRRMSGDFRSCGHGHDHPRSIPLLLIPFLFCVLPARLRAPVCIKKISRPLILKQLLNRSAKWRLQFVKRRWCLVCCNRRFT